MQPSHLTMLRCKRSLAQSTIVASLPTLMVQVMVSGSTR
uniref:Uncharacterized protein n=1 Tax=Arundo donax TaxID=35708 RepID=A0A0A8ZUR1_ARUDO